MSDHRIGLTPSGARVVETLAYGLTNHPTGVGRLAAVVVEHLDGRRGVEVIPLSALILTSVPWQLGVIA